jgi:hypothetical protein
MLGICWLAEELPGSVSFCLVVMEVVMDRLFLMWKLYNHVGPCVLHSCYGSDFIAIMLEFLIRYKTPNISVAAELRDMKDVQGVRVWVT